VEGTVQLLDTWASLPESDKVRMGTAAKQCFAENFDLTANSEKFFQMLREGITSSGSINEIALNRR
jgi:hypothetical protein